jgi:para-nitrobenzyl esterase
MKSNRRGFIQKVAISTATLGLGTPIMTDASTYKQKSGKRAVVESSVSRGIVETNAGKVQGYIRNGIYIYKGIPYAGNTAGANRFMPPTKPTSWTGVRSALAYGPTCPTVPRAGWANDEEKFLMDWSDGIPGEDCLRVNVWTPGVNDNKKRPVMFWIHGGGFTSGSSEELPAYDGENLCHRGDVVVVSLNHRLNAFGFLDLSEIGGDKYASSGNVGMLDVVAALEWVRDNIASFGGDPGNVMIFGQSGGGSKVGTLMAMPAAKGLFHKAIVQSGSGLRMIPKENSLKMTAAFLAALNLNAATLDQLHALPYSRLVEAAGAATRIVMLNGSGPATPGSRVGWGPVVDGDILPQHPFDPIAPAISASVPMMIGTVANERSPAFANPADESLTTDQVREQLQIRYGVRADSIKDAYSRHFPNVKPIELLSLINSPRTNAVTQAERKAGQGGSQVYMYWFTWKTPVLDSRPRSFHCSELPFVFDNIDRCEQATGGGQEPKELAAKISQAWINFARTGNPNHKGLPKWPAFTAEKGETMVFDKVCAVQNDPDREPRRLLSST